MLFECVVCSVVFFFFFFQAEDGIRDLTVTGVQTCALPISRDLRVAAAGGYDTGAARGEADGDGKGSRERGAGSHSSRCSPTVSVAPGATAPCSQLPLFPLRLPQARPLSHLGSGQAKQPDFDGRVRRG